MPSPSRSTALLAGCLAAAACELQEVSLTTPEDVIVAEVYLQAADEGSRATALLHRTLTGSGATKEVAGAEIRIFPEAGEPVLFSPSVESNCLVGGEPLRSCYVSGTLDETRFGPGRSIALVIDLPDGGRLTGSTTVPGDFQLLRPSVDGTHIASDNCSLPPGQTLEVLWSSSKGTWAYVSETLIFGLRAALGPRGIRVDEDPLLLLGLSISARDTTIVFPSEFGVFDRFEENRELLLALQDGLPSGTVASVVVSATDRNYVNWVRGGDFNPSGQVRIPSLHGDGTGVFASFVRKRFFVEVAPPAPDRPPCQ